jgi:cation diffusion facilitator family transporter
MSDASTPQRKPASEATRLAAVTIAVGLVVLALKFVAWRVTGSVALYADAIESIVNVLSAAVALYAVWYGARPADSRHPYGHQKAEYLSAVFEGALIIVAALAIVRAAIIGLLMPTEIEQPLAGVAVNAAASTVNALWGGLLLREGRRLRSPALVADALHLMADVWSSVAVLAGLGLAIATGIRWLDPALAFCVAIHVLRSGSKLLAESVGGLMDEAVDTGTLEDIERLIERERGGTIEAHDIRTRQAGRRTFVEFHLVVPSGMTVLEAHVICDRIEAGLQQRLGDATINIHVEPAYKANHGMP